MFDGAVQSFGSPSRSPPGDVHLPLGTADPVDAFRRTGRFLARFRRAVYHPPDRLPRFISSPDRHPPIMRLSIHRPAIVLATALAGCLGAAVPAHAQPADASALSGTWTGTYECPQGTTALELELRGNANGIIRGTFSFSPTAEDPDAASGTYPLLGRLTGTSLVLRPIDVQHMPPGYAPVGILGTLDTPRRMSGWIEGPGCGALDVTRTTIARPNAPLPGGYGQQQWAKVLEVDAGALFMDIRERDDMGASVDLGWMRWESRADDPASGARAGEVTEWEVEFDCDAALVRVWHLLRYAPDGQLVWFGSSAPLQWAAIEDGSMYQRVWEHACYGVLLPEA